MLNMPIDKSRWIQISQMKFGKKQKPTLPVKLDKMNEAMLENTTWACEVAASLVKFDGIHTKIAKTWVNVGITV